MHLVGSEAEYDWEWLADEDLGRVLWPVAHSAAELLVSEQLSRVRMCDADTCRWLFVDTSKSGTALVRHESLWQPCQGPASLRPDAIGRC
jgi:predicted RNA-binding Zn ribbon-like protein